MHYLCVIFLFLIVLECESYSLRCTSIVSRNSMQLFSSDVSIKTDADESGVNIKLDNILNMRDLSTASPFKISRNKIFRSGCPSKASAADINILQELGIKYLLDLRSHRELVEDENLKGSAYLGYESIEYNSKRKEWESKSEHDNVSNDSNDSSGSDNKRLFLSLMSESVVKKGVFLRLRKRERLQVLAWGLLSGISKRAEKKMKSFFVEYINNGGLELLNELVVDNSPHLVIEALKQIAKDSSPIVLYCTAGKDRTGLLSMLILSVLGASDDEIIADYILSDNAYKAMNNKKAMVASLQQEDLNPDIFLTAKAPVMEHTIQYIRSKYGSINEFLDTYGFDNQWREKLKVKAGQINY